MLTPTMHSVRLTHMTPVHQTIFTVLSSTPKSIATVAAALGISQDLAEKQLSALVDEGLAVRTPGDRTTARYTST
jgi:predicted ArsR family transcriptional regulator